MNTLPETLRKAKLNAIKITMTACAALLAMAPLPFAAIATAQGSSVELSISCVIMAAGITLGWFAGILVSPYEDKKEQQIFQSYAKVFSAGASGYLIARIEPILSASLVLGDPMEPLKLLRIFGFMVTFLVALMCVFGWRRYWPD